MRSIRSFLSVPALCGLVTIFLAASPPSASGITVDYSTTGVISGTSPNLDFFGVLAGSVEEPTIASFGTFEAYAAPDHDYTGETFTLSIIQTVPGAGAGSVVGKLTGMLLMKTSGLVLEFAPSDVVTIVSGGYSVVYNPVNETPISPSSTNFGLTTLQGTITASVIPLPAAAWGGMALFGVLGGVKLRRSRQSFVA